MTLLAPAPVTTRHGAGFWMIAGAFLIAMAFSTVPTPLYPLYSARDGFSTLTGTIVFAVYAVGVVISLLLAGHISDWTGRKRILIPALGLELAAAVLFLAGTALPVLLAARFLTGLGVGLITATATAYLHDLHTAHRPGASKQRFEIVSTAANTGGLGFGSLLAGGIAAFTQTPLRTPYVVFAVLLLVAVAAVALTPETVLERPAEPVYRPQRFTADRAVAGYLAAGFAAFAVFGLFTSVAPGFVAGTLHHPSRLLAGAVVFAVFGAAAAAQALTGRLTATAKLALGLAAQAAGVVLLLAGMSLASLPLFVLGGMIAGVGAGTLFKTAVAMVSALAAPERRGESLAGLFLAGYLGLTAPVIGLGLATQAFTALTAMTGFAVLILALLGTVAALTMRRLVIHPAMPPTPR
ncbi:MFS family permease [Actinoplanes octamycinicus]|uniref:MFS family permease n=1 Tax=Actinoplanes octamycinicus TaxID=135948 RepID=A0A7W7MCM1_9ACTN|nr:MFS transporter [Actinoplanes octamycinicus]MBB4745294.1 MFS family permease [Actinoplanes octamycinicus]GIE62227.1 MFS transporter [Actinoplanes octamycinicus]